MDNFDFVQLYWKENNMTEKLLAIQKVDKIFNRNSRMTDEESPPEFILIPIGQYHCIHQPDCIVDENYTVWLEIPNPEYGEVII